MNQEIKTKWLESLRSGQFVQGKGFLKQIDSAGNASHCCLGVLAEIQGFRIVPSIAAPSSRGLFAADTTLCKSVRDFVGLEGWAHADLANMNDNEGKTFGEIADWIEQNL